MTIGDLKKFLSNFDDNVPVRIFNHYVGYSINADVYRKMSKDNLFIGYENKDEKTPILMFCVNKGDYKRRWITQETENSAPFEMVSARIC